MNSQVSVVASRNVFSLLERSNKMWRIRIRFFCVFFIFSFLVCGCEWGRRSSRELETQLFIFPFINLTCWLFFVVEEIGKLNFTVQRPPVSVNLLINCAIRYLQFSFILWVIFWISSNDDVPHSRDRHRYLYAARFMTLCVMFMFEVNEYVWSESIWWRWRKKKIFLKMRRFRVVWIFRKSRDNLFPSLKLFFDTSQYCGDMIRFNHRICLIYVFNIKFVSLDNHKSLMTRNKTNVEVKLGHKTGFFLIRSVMWADEF